MIRSASSNGNGDVENRFIGQGPSDEACESSYTPPLVLQEQVDKLEEILERENWMKLTKRSRAEHNRDAATSAASDDTTLELVASMMFDMDDEDDVGSIGSNQSLKEELEWAEMELGISPTREATTKIGHEASLEREMRSWGKAAERVNDSGSMVQIFCPALNGSEPSIIVKGRGSSTESSRIITESRSLDTRDTGDCTSTFDPTIPPEASNCEGGTYSMTSYSAESESEQEIDIRTVAESQTRNGHSTEKHQEDGLSLSQVSKSIEALVSKLYSDSSVIRRIHRSESILVVSSALFAASFFLGGSNKKQPLQPMRFKPFHAY